MLHQSFEYLSFAGAGGGARASSRAALI
jgi:hypothetical protein